MDERAGSTRTGVCVWVCVNLRNAGQKNPVIAGLR